MSVGDETSEKNPFKRRKHRAFFAVTSLTPRKKSLSYNLKGGSTTEAGFITSYT
jgi:hypothetical protein